MKALLNVLAMMAVAGCASQSISIRTVPDQTPAADNAAAAANAAAFAQAASAADETAHETAQEQQAHGEPAPGTAARSPSAPNAAPPTITAANAPAANAPAANAPAANAPAANAADVAAPVTPADAPPMYTYDPWERLNRFTYRFNARFDEAIFLPVADTYRRLPSPLRAGVHNFFGNLSEIDSVINYTLQWRLKYGVRSLERLLINSTIGIGGLFDAATKLKLPGTPTGFATTLAKWGMHPGPYLVIPLLGPSTLRGGIGYATDYGTDYAINVFDLYRGDVSWGLGVADAIDLRANVSFRYYSTGSPFEYETIRFLYVRKLLIEDEGLHAKARRKNSQAGEPAGK